MLKLISSLFSYLKKVKKIQVISEILFFYLKKAKKNHVLSGILFLFLIIIIFSIKGPSGSNESDKEIISTQLDEKINHKSHDLSKNTKDEIQKLKNAQTAKNQLSKSIKPQEKKPKKKLIKNQLEKPQKNKIKPINPISVPLGAFRECSLELGRVTLRVFFRAMYANEFEPVTNVKDEPITTDFMILNSIVHFKSPEFYNNP